MVTATTINKHGQKVTATVGKGIWFKADIEQWAEVLDIRMGGWNGRIIEVQVEETYDDKTSIVWNRLEDCWN